MNFTALVEVNCLASAADEFLLHRGNFKLAFAADLEM